MDYAKNNKGIYVPAKVGGVFHAELIRGGKIIDRWKSKNLVTYQGLDSLLNVYLAGGPQLTTWYLGVYKGNYAPAAGDTANSFPNNATECTDYQSNTRPAYTVAEANQVATNAATPASFVFTANATIYGAFLISSSGKGSTSGTLFSASGFAGAKTVAAQDQLNLTYVVAAQSS